MDLMVPILQVFYLVGLSLMACLIYFWFIAMTSEIKLASVFFFQNHDFNFHLEVTFFSLTLTPSVLISPSLCFSLSLCSTSDLLYAPCGPASFLFPFSPLQSSLSMHIGLISPISLFKEALHPSLLQLIS